MSGSSKIVGEHPLEGTQPPAFPPAPKVIRKKKMWECNHAAAIDTPEGLECVDCGAAIEPSRAIPGPDAFRVSSREFREAETLKAAQGMIKTPEEWDALRKGESLAFEHKFDPVNKPKHYNSHPSGIQCIEVTRHMGFNLGNAIKYIWRADEKGVSIQDMEKAIWYIQDEIAKRKGEKRIT